MPRNGDGSSDNGPIDATHNVAHGVPQSGENVGTTSPALTRRRRSPPEEGPGPLSDANASGGQSQV